jgi:hypothetical protein
MSGKRRWLAVGSAIALVLVAVTAAYLHRDAWFPSGVTKTSIQPLFVSPVGDGTDPRGVQVAFTWMQNGYCLGQFHVTATETATQVRVSPVVSTTYADGNCAGVGSSGKWAWTPLTLASPLGNRRVIRESDGVALPVFAPDMALACDQKIYTIDDPPADQQKIFDEVALPDKALQANTSGESDPSALLFAKTGLYITPGASFGLRVPDDWIGRLAIGWGSPAVRTVHLFVPGCEETAVHRQWFVYAGGFWVAQPACVPLLVDSGGQEQTVHIGVGTACPGQAAPPSGA